MNRPASSEDSIGVEQHENVASSVARLNIGPKRRWQCQGRIVTDLRLIAHATTSPDKIQVAASG